MSPGRGSVSDRTREKDPMDVPPISVPRTPGEEYQRLGLLQPPARLGTMGRFGGFEILDTIGQGGMGVVLLTRRPESDEKLALKMLRPEFSNRGDLMNRFRDEARLLEALEHPHIVPLLEIVEGTGAVAMLMPLYSEGCLADRTNRRCSLDRENLLLIVEQVADALAYAHSRGVIHYDLKPENILFETRQHIRLADFGLARSLGASVAEIRAHVGEGTIHYRSPGLVAGIAEDTRADTYSLGAILYQLLVGRPPYSGSSIEGIRAAILKGPPVPIRELDPAADEDLVWISERAMARSQDDRYTTMSALLADVRAAKRGETLPSRPVAPVSTRSVVFSLRTLVPMGVLGLFVLMGMVWWAMSVQLDEIFSFESGRVSRWETTNLIQWDGLPGEELVTISGNSLLVFSPEGELLAEARDEAVNYPWTAITRPLDLDLDGRHEIPLLRGDALTTEVLYFDQHPLPTARYSITPSPADRRNGSFTSYLYPQIVNPASSTRSGRAEVVALVGTDYCDPAKSPWQRGLAAFDRETSELLWMVKSGGPMVDLQRIDLDGDSYPDYVAGTGSVRNGNVGTYGDADLEVHLYGIRDTGEVLWRKQVGGEFDGCYAVGTETRGGESLVVCSIFRGEFGNDSDTGFPSRVISVNGRGEIVLETRLDSPLQHSLVVDLDGDGDLEVAILDRNGRISLVKDGEQSKPLALMEVTGAWRNPLDRVLATFVGHGKFRAGEPDLFAVAVCESFHHGELNPGDDSMPPTIKEYRNRKLVLLDQDLNVVYECRINRQRGPFYASNCRSIDVDGDGILEVMTLTDSVDVFSLRSPWEKWREMRWRPE